jgi:serine protease AprX
VLQNAHGGHKQRVIIRFRPGADASIEQRLRGNGAHVFGRFSSFGALTAELKGEDLAAFANDPDVESIGIDADVAADASPSTDTSVPSAVLRSTLGEGDYSKGGGIGVAIIDSGIAPLPAFDGRITSFYDVTSGTPVAAPPSDEYGHGTHVAGLIGANDSNYMGVAPGVTFVGMKVLNKSGKGSTSDVIAALDGALGVELVEMLKADPSR